MLVRVHAAGANIGDHHVVTGKPYLIRLSPFCGLPRPRSPVPGTTMAGRVEAVGAKVTTFRPGDEVFGEAPAGAFAEYAVVPAKRLAPKPSNLSFEEAAAAPWAVTRAAGAARRRRLAGGPACPDQRRLGRRGHVGGPNREGARRPGDGSLQHAQRRRWCARSAPTR